MAVNTQVSGNKVHTIQASKNLGTVINTQVSGEKSAAQHGYKKLTNVQATQVSGQQNLTNYMGINDEGMDIFATKKHAEDELNLETNPTIYEGKQNIIDEVNAKIETQEADKKRKYAPVSESTPEEGGDDENGEGGEGSGTTPGEGEENGDEVTPEEGEE